MANDKLTRKGLYSVVDRISFQESEALGFDKKPIGSITFGPAKNLKAQWTGKKRCPKAGEWYLSGSIIEAYKAFNDLSTPYHIAKLVRTETVTTVIETVVSE